MVFLVNTFRTRKSSSIRDCPRPAKKQIRNRNKHFANPAIVDTLQKTYYHHVERVAMWLCITDVP